MPVCVFALVVLTVSVEETTVPPLVVTDGAEHVVAINGETSEQVNVMVDPLVPCKFRVKLEEPLAGTVKLVVEGVTEKSGTPVSALTKAPTSGDPKPVTRS